MTRSRLSKLGDIKDLELKYSKTYSKKIFEKLCKIKFFEEQVREAHKQKLTTPLVYLSLGQEAVSTGVSFQMQNSYVLAQHRGHDPCLAFGTYNIIKPPPPAPNILPPSAPFLIALS